MEYVLAETNWYVQAFIFTGPGRGYCLSPLLPPNSSTFAYWTDGFMEALYFACGLLSSEARGRGKGKGGRGSVRLEGCIKLLQVASDTSMVAAIAWSLVSLCVQTAEDEDVRLQVQASCSWW
jgi:hypothetical protein